jgi:hypothetical protein
MRPWAAVTCSVLLAGCGSGPSQVDVTGVDATITHKTCTTQNLDSLPYGEGHGILTFTQTAGQGPAGTSR